MSECNANGCSSHRADVSCRQLASIRRKILILTGSNNALLYPALGLGAILSGAKVISPAMLMAAVHALASQSPALSDANAALLPDLSDVRTVSVPIAAGVIRQAIEEGVATDEEAISTAKEKNEKDLQKMIADNMWNPVYRPLELVD